ncbi:MAG: hypothetical protein IID51_11810 [Proteobacteria bacterium]|nr:hypothetical protein [Pseudomonadota bacterium]
MFDMSGISAAFARPGIGGNEGTQRASAVQQMAEAKKTSALPATAAPPKASNSNFTHTTAVQKEALRWETFAADTFEAMKTEINYHNHILKFDDAYWAQKEEIMGAKYVEISKKYVKERLAATEGNLAEMQQGLVDNGFVISGAIYQKNDLGEFEFGNFKVSKSGSGYKLLFEGPEKSETDYRPVWSSRGRDRISMLNDDLFPVLFRERR